MDLAPQTEPIEELEAKSESVGEKRPIGNGGDGELMVPLKKKARCGTGEMKRVAEIVLVLSAMAEIRGGRSPTAVEAEMMAEARAKVAAMCEKLAPKDVVEGEAIGVVIEDLALNFKAKEQKLGFRPPKISIAEKFLLTKRRMEESKEFAAHSGTYSSQQLQTGLGAAAESRGTSHTNRVLPLDKPSNAPISSGGFPTAPPLGSSTSLPYQYPTNEVRPSMVSRGLPGSHVVRDSSSLALPRVERANFRLDAGAIQVQDSSVDHALVNAPTWSLQPQSASAAKGGPESKVQNHTSIKVDRTVSRVAPQATRDQTSRPIITQITSGNLLGSQQPLQGTNFTPTPLSNNHNEIGKIVHKLLQPRLPEHPTWTPPSRDYMNKALTCQICQLTINEVENALLCDACEKGFHLKCLQAYNQKGIPRGEWHCPKCLTLSNGKPLPPKYGRVMRNMNTPKVPPKLSSAQSTSDNKVGNLDQKANQRKITANGSSSFQSSPQTGPTGSDCVESGSILGIPKSREMQGNNFSSSINMEGKLISETSQNDSMKAMGADCGSPVGSASGKSVQEVQNSKSFPCEEGPVSLTKSMSPSKLPDMVTNVSDHSQASNKSQDVDQTGLPKCAEMPTKEHLDNNNMVKISDIKETFDCIPRCDIKQDNQDVAQAGPYGTSGVSAGTRERTGFSTDGLCTVDWIGDALNAVDEKTFYSSCCINGVSYKVRDHALFRSRNDKLVPSKLQAMWEDSKTGSKWVIVNCCYFPGDLPEVVRRPCTPESNEVYESNNNSTIMAGLIQGACEVLPPEKYKYESERIRLGSEASDEIQPVFLCKWLYDEFKGLFQPIST